MCLDIFLITEVSGRDSQNTLGMDLMPDLHQFCNALTLINYGNLATSRTCLSTSVPWDSGLVSVWSPQHELHEKH